ncbi:hypothetical protein D9M71_316020 [compost metagenome]
MEYVFEYTEKTAQKASEFETKALLYLIGIDKDKKKISLAFIDCFNDITGTDKNSSALWDVQSKGVANMSPSQIGRSLITLLFNQISSLNFCKLALFMPEPKPEYTVHSGLTEFGIENLKPIEEKIRAGLIKEWLKRKSLIKLDPTQNTAIDEFFSRIRFIVDKPSTADYIKNITPFKSLNLKKDEFYNSIFKEIKEQQTLKKLSSIHNAKINHIAEALEFDRHITSLDLSKLIINRFVGHDLFKFKSIPISFLPEISGLSKEDAKELIFVCNQQITKAFFDKNKRTIFWKFLENSILTISEFPDLSSREVYEKSKAISGFESSNFHGLPGIFFISIIIDGIENALH